VRAGCGTIEYGIARYGYGERTEMGGHVGGWIECRAANPGHLISKSALLGFTL
jgi:hypothetical protein